MAKMKIKVPYLTTRIRQGGGLIYYWQPNKQLRDLGFKLKRLSDDPTTAMVEARAENQRVAAARSDAKAGRKKRPVSVARNDQLPLSPRERARKPAWVYVIGRSDGKLKIGVSRDPKRRLADLGTANAEPLSLIASVSVPAPAHVERFLHGLFARNRVGGEWFVIDPQRVTRVLSGLGQILAPEAERM